MKSTQRVLFQNRFLRNMPGSGKNKRYDDEYEPGPDETHLEMNEGEGKDEIEGAFEEGRADEGIEVAEVHMPENVYGHAQDLSREEEEVFPPRAGIVPGGRRAWREYT